MAERDEYLDGLLVEDAIERAVEYRDEAERLEQVLSTVGLSFDQLSQLGKESVWSLATSARALHLRDTAMESFVAALVETSVELQRVQERRQAIRERVERMRELGKKTEQSIERLHEHEIELEEQVDKTTAHANGRLRDVGVMEQKSKQYDLQRQNVEQLLLQRGFDEELVHSKLVAQAKEVHALQEKKNALLQQLRYYQDLPPDVTLAKVVIEEKKRRVREAERKIEDTMALLS